MRNRLLATSLALSIVIGAPSAALAWGAGGHSVVAEIAQRRLSAVTQRHVMALLGGNTSLASVASWADTQAVLHATTRRWHYVNIPLGSESYSAVRDCKLTAEGDCVVAAIDRFQRILGNRRLPRAQRTAALKYLVHLVADAHQPLHCAERDGDAGGNGLKVQYFGAPLSLHQVWDYAMLDRATYDWGEHVEQAEAWLKTQNAKALARGTPLIWIMESHKLAATVAYDTPSDLALAEAYNDRALPVARQQLAKAGVRLAAVLTQALAPPAVRAAHRRRAR
jgi:nuclease S1